MADRRSIEPAMLAHPLFRRASLVAREVWLGLILTADDEGRLRLDPVALAEAIFSPLTHKVTAKKMQEAFDFWSTSHENGKTPWLLTYNDGSYGFLTGWYEHQYIRPGERDRPGDREESSLPLPPVPVNSWQAADAVYRWYCRRQGQKKTYYRLALRALSQLTVEQQYATVAEELRNLPPKVAEELPPEGKGREEEGEGKGIAPPTAFGMKRPNGPMLLQEYCRLSDAVREVYGKDWSLGQQQAFVADAGAALEEAGCKVAEDEAIASITGDGKPEPGRRGDWWIGDLCKAKRNGKCTTGDPVLDDFIKQRGARPDGVYEGPMWDMYLADFRAEQGAKP